MLHNKSIKYIILTTLAQGTIYPCWADSTELDPITVTATRTEQTKSDVLAPVIIIGTDEIERNPGADVADLLRMHAGIEIGRNGGPGQLSSVFIRGADSNHTLVLVDGIAINPGTIGNPAIQNISPNMIERIEVVKGPRSTLYGSNAIGGVIQIITKRANRGTQIDARIGAGRYDTRAINLGIHHGNDRIKLGIHIQDLGTNGFPTRTDSDIDSGYNNQTTQIYGNFNFQDTELRLDHWRAQGNTEYLDGFPGLIAVDQDFVNRTSSIGLNSELNRAWSTKLQLSLMEDELEQNRSPDFLKTRSQVLDWQNDFSLGDQNLITAGLTYTDQKTDSTIFFATTGTRRVTISEFFVQDDIRVEKHHLLVSGRVTNHELFDTHSSWNIEYGIDFSDAWQVIASAGTGFRAPDATDLYSPFGGNEELEPEVSQNLELATKYTYHDNHSLHLNLFDNRIDDLIDFDFIDFIPKNIGEARIRGAELGYQFLDSNWDVNLAVTTQRPEQIDPFTGEYKPLLRRAEELASLNANYRFKSFSLGADVIASGRRTDVDPINFTTIETGGYTLINLNGRWQIGRPISLAARLENLTDKDYELAAGFNSPGRSLFVELRYHPKVN